MTPRRRVASRSVAETDRRCANATRFGESAFDVSDSSGADDGEHPARAFRAPGTFRYPVHASPPDDAFQPCHHLANAPSVRDPHGLLVCAEGDLDKVFARDPRTYAAYVDALEWTLRAGADVGSHRTRGGERDHGRVARCAGRRAVAAGLAELVAANPDARTRRGALADIEGSPEFYTGGRPRTAANALPPRRAVPGLRRVGGALRGGRFANGTATDKITVPFEPKRTPARSALRREAARDPIRGTRVCFEGGGRSGGSSSRRLRASTDTMRRPGRGSRNWSRAASRSRTSHHERHKPRTPQTSSVWRYPCRPSTCPFAPKCVTKT